MEELKFEGHRKVRLYGRKWEISGAKACLVVVHGFGEHSGRYSDIADYLCSRGIGVVAFDWCGHGLSEGKRGLILRWKDLWDDLDSALSLVGKLYPVIPIFLLGHSMGGTILLDYAQSSGFAPRGMIVSAPALGTPGVSKFLLTISKVLTLLAPKLRIGVGLDSNAMSRDPLECQKYREDPLVHDRVCVGFGRELAETQKRVFSRAPLLTSPILLCYGAADRVAPRKPIEDFYAQVGAEDRRLVIFDDAYHELHSDVIREEVYRLYADWILERV